MREKLGLQEGEPEGGQCMLLSTAASSLWRQHGTPPHQKEVHALATRYRAELLEAAGDAPPASSSPLDDALRAGAAVPHSGRDYREFPLLGGPALTSVDLHREEAGGGVKRMGGGNLGARLQSGPDPSRDLSSREIGTDAKYRTMAETLSHYSGCPFKELLSHSIDITM
ncbi:unnamed protein product [Prorocentrum cordatum]|uniref:Uncharacterized protein n=1 Tax=Prorocentrum cordatum TaxID=2364126 RepID=A0ABN9TUA5_9DINO|nr:unnamed protein product [Polarella glacialis]